MLLLTPFFADALGFAYERLTTEGKVTIGMVVVVSLLSWTVMIQKGRQLYLANTTARRFFKAYRGTRDPMELFNKEQEFPGAPAYEVYFTGAEEVAYHLKNNPVHITTFTRASPVQRSRPGRPDRHVRQNPPAGTLLGPGTFAVTVTATDTAGQNASCSTSVNVVDKTPPTIVGVVPSQTSLWPPNGKMVPVTLLVDASDNCGPVQCQVVEITSSEPVTGPNDSTTPDWQITGPLSVDLRAERSDNGPGRIYTITFKCTDATGNSATKKAISR